MGRAFPLFFPKTTRPASAGGDIISAFEVCKAHIDFLITAGLKWAHTEHSICPVSWYIPGPPSRQDKLDHTTADAVGMMLIRENCLSVHHRYDERPTAVLEDPYVFSRVHKKIDPVQVLKAIDCLDYQSCEHPGWEDSEGRKFLMALKAKAISQLPGYEEAQWEVR